jgi:hypothetical protein
MIILVGTTDLTQQAAAACATEAIETLGGAVAGLELDDPDLVRIHFTVPGMGVPALGSYLASGGIQLDPAAETVLAGTSSGFHASALGGVLVVRVGEDAIPEQRAG